MKLIIPIIIFGGLTALLIFAVKFVFTLMTGAMNAVLGVFVVIALLFIVAWMFSYAKK